MKNWSNTPEKCLSVCFPRNVGRSPYTKKLWGDSKRFKLIHADFTTLEPNESTAFNLLCTNPPYVRHHHIEKALKEKLKQKIGLNISGLSGLYCYFILLSHKWLQKGALSAWLIPSEYMNVNYGKVIKQYLTETVTVKHIHKYDSDDAKFEDALVSSSILLYENKTPKDTDKITFTFGGNINKPLFSTTITLAELKKIDKWSILFNQNEVNKDESAYKLSDFFKITRGIATGRNDFFILKESEIRHKELPFECFKPILPTPKSLKNIEENVIESDENGLPILEENLFLLDTNLDIRVIEDEFPNLFNYLQKGMHEGVHKTYLASKRKIWYSQENRDPAPFLCTYMGRGKSEINPFKIIWNKSHAICTNGYLMLYPQGILKDRLHKNPSLYREIHLALKSIGYDHFVNAGREYGGGLKKVEPKELGSISARKITEVLEINQK